MSNEVLNAPVCLFIFLWLADQNGVLQLLDKLWQVQLLWILGRLSFQNIRLEIIDFSDEVKIIKKRYGAYYYSNPNAIRELAKLWGTSPNKHGVLPYEKHTIVEIGSCRGQISFARTSKTYWLTSVSASSAFNGVGSAPSVSDCIGYGSYQKARLEGVKKLIAFFTAVARDLSSCNSKTNKANALKAVSFFKGRIEPSA